LEDLEPSSLALETRSMQGVCKRDSDQEDIRTV